jgi:threonine dehydrogenase-like Zn-dependent dehydrogenase
MDCAGGEVPKQQAVRCTAPWGRIVLVAVGGNLNVDGMKDVIGKQRTIIGSYTFSEVWMKNCAYFIADHGVEVHRLLKARAGEGSLPRVRQAGRRQGRIRLLTTARFLRCQPLVRVRKSS